MHKFILLILIILNFSSCEDEVLRAQNCSVNDVAVDCASMQPQANPNTSNPGSSLTVKLSANYDFDDNGYFEFANGGQERVEDSYGNSCELTIPNIQMQYEISADGLSLTFADEESNTSTFYRSSSTSSIFGRWNQVDGENGMTTILTLETNGVIKFELTCQF